MDGDAYSQLPPHAKQLLQNWLPILGIVRRNDDNGSGSGEVIKKKALAIGGNGGDHGGWELDVKRDGWRLPSTPPFRPMERRGVVRCKMGYDEDSPDGMPEILWRN